MPLVRALFQVERGKTRSRAENLCLLVSELLPQANVPNSYQELRLESCRSIIAGEWPNCSVLKVEKGCRKLLESLPGAFLEGFPVWSFCRPRVGVRMLDDDDECVDEWL